MYHFVRLFEVWFQFDMWIERERKRKFKLTNTTIVRFEWARMNNMRLPFYKPRYPIMQCKCGNLSAELQRNMFSDLLWTIRRKLTNLSYHQLKMNIFPNGWYSMNLNVSLRLVKPATKHEKKNYPPIPISLLSTQAWNKGKENVVSETS